MTQTATLAVDPAFVVGPVRRRTFGTETGELTVLAVNRSRTEEVALAVGLRPFGGLDVVEALTLSHSDRTRIVSAA